MKEPTTVIQDSPVARFLFSDVRFAAFWLVVRVYVGWLWLDAGWHKVQDPKWMDTGASILGYWKGAVAVPAQGSPRITFDWYRNFLQFLIDNDLAPAFGRAIAVGETLVGIGLIVGAFVGVAAFFGAAMNFNFMLAGSTSTNPMLFFLAVLLIMAWKTAGYYGLDRYLLPALGTPWQPIPMLKGGGRMPAPGAARA
ncbi:MAG TPA: DoxX family membrane protein [Candidatus Limnocylindria bacterium]|nr:DoxX family membrane protein [Candidatus Limnocylindria bacterium]